ncbi:hypothetical protein PBI_EDMUNDO_38 [Arthrobacter phage Edmundo]|nr:hypothetical protein PBI_EDMUNDO_38 [Arthrobacter phage Edmundo]
MPLRNATIESNGTGRGTVLVDGSDLSEVVGRVEFISQPGQVDRLILTTTVAARLDTADAEVVVDEKTRLALICLGWTPPALKVEGECPTTPHVCGDEDRGPVKRATWNSRVGRNSCMVDNPCDACLERGDEPRPDRIADPQGFHQPTLREALDAYLESLPQRYSPVVKGIRALMTYYPLPKLSDPVTCRCFTG